MKSLIAVYLLPCSPALPRKPRTVRGGADRGSDATGNQCNALGNAVFVHNAGR